MTRVPMASPFSVKESYPPITLLTIAFWFLASATARALEETPLAADCTSMVSAARMNCTASEVSEEEVPG